MTPLRKAALRAALAIAAPARLAAQLLELYWRLRSCVSERKRAHAQASEFAKLLGDLPTLTIPWAQRLQRKSDTWKGRGIVIVAGGEKYGPMAVRLVRALRSSSCTLPIEVFYLGREEIDGCPAMSELTTYDNVTLRNLLAGQPTLRDTPGFGYAAKPLALATSSFAEVLLLDADNMVLRDPTHLFESRQYSETGAVFWSDMYYMGETFLRLYDPYDVRRQPFWLEALIQDGLDAWLVRGVRIKPDYGPALAAIGMPACDATQESGQLLIDKRRCIAAVAAVGLLNSNSNRPLVYSGLHGDKANAAPCTPILVPMRNTHRAGLAEPILVLIQDTFRCAFRALSTTYHQVSMRPLLGGHVEPTTGVFHDTCFMQPDLSPLGKPLFLHSCGRHRNDDARHGELPTAVMVARGRPFKLWPYDGRRGYWSGTVEKFEL